MSASRNIMCERTLASLTVVQKIMNTTTFMHLKPIFWEQSFEYQFSKMFSTFMSFINALETKVEFYFKLNWLRPRPLLVHTRHSIQS